jgi:pseudouridine synthase
MEEKFRHRKGSPRNSEKDESATDMNNYEDINQKNTFKESDEKINRNFRPRRPDGSGQYYDNANSSDRSRYDEIQPSYNASRQDFEQRQARPFRRFDNNSQPHRGNAPYQPRPRNTGYYPNGGGRPTYNERPYGRQDNVNGYSPRPRREQPHGTYPGFKKSGKHSNDPLPKKIKEKPLTIIKALGNLHFGSRNVCLDAIRDGLVKINGITVTKQNAPYYPSRDVVSVNNVTLRTSDPSLYIAFHKPAKLSGSAESGEQSIYSVLDKKTGWYFPAGCLNKAASGIVVVTNDATHKNLATSPISGSLKEYHIKIHAQPKPKEITVLKTHLQNLATAGLEVLDVSLLKTTARHSWISVTMKKGNLTELRKAVKEAGFEILAFKRFRVGGFTADELPEGSWKRLTEDEINLLTSSAELVETLVGDAGDDDKKPKWQQLYQQWFKST